METNTPTTPLSPADPRVIYYGPHACARCGRTIVKAAFEQGGAEFDAPRVEDGPIYPNSFTPHACESSAPHREPESAPVAPSLGDPEE